jgi:hypothetical protein
VIDGRTLPPRIVEQLVVALDRRTQQDLVAAIARERGRNKEAANGAQTAADRPPVGRV